MNVPVPDALRPAARVVRRTSMSFVAPVRRAVRPRRFQAYGVGTGKTGTASMDGMFRSYRSAHEPGARELIDYVLAAAERGATPEARRRFLRARDARLWLEFESSQLLGFVIEDLVAAFPEARFVLTVRDCYSWLDSVINHDLSRPIPDAWRRIADYRTQHDRWPHGPGEEALTARGLYSLDAMLSSWSRHNQRVLDAVPADRLLVVRTHEIRQAMPAIAAFIGIPLDTLKPGASHLNTAVARHDVLRLLDTDLIEAKVDRHCRALMDAYFPGLRLGDALRA